MARFCKYCGKELCEEADVCLSCGKSVEKVRLNSNNQDTNSIIKIVLFIAGVVMLLPLISVVIAIITPLVTNSFRHHTESGIKKTCCQQYGGVWKENVCKSPEITGMEFDVNGYYNCIAD